MSEEKPKIVFARITMPDGKEYVIPLPPKVFSSGRHGFYGPVPPLVYDDDVYGGQIQIWKKSPDDKNDS